MIEMKLVPTNKIRARDEIQTTDINMRTLKLNYIKLNQHITAHLRNITMQTERTNMQLKRQQLYACIQTASESNPSYHTHQHTRCSLVTIIIFAHV